MWLLILGSTLKVNSDMLHSVIPSLMAVIEDSCAALSWAMHVVWQFATLPERFLL
jgi:hypothetical protein